jgi:hypothetical protein
MLLALAREPIARQLVLMFFRARLLLMQNYPVSGNLNSALLSRGQIHELGGDMAARSALTSGQFKSQWVTRQSRGLCDMLILHCGTSWRLSGC